MAKLAPARADIGARHLREAQSIARHRYKLVAEPAAIRADEERTLKERRRLDEHLLNRLRCQKLHFNIASGTFGQVGRRHGISAQQKTALSLLLHLFEHLTKAL